jgi:GAF domain-containing protein
MPVKDRKLQRQDFDGSAALKKLLEVGQSLAAIQDLGSLLQNVTESAGSALGADIVVLYEYQEETHDVNVPPVFWGDIRHPEVLRERGRVRLHRESAVFKMLSKRRKRPFYAPNAKKDWGRIIEQEPQEEGESGSFLHREDIASSAAVRLTADAERVGVLFVNYRTHHDFPDKERKVIELFATQAAAAIRDARLRADLQCQVERLQTLNQVSRELSAKLDKESIFDTVVKAVVRTLDCTHCTFFVLENNLLVPCASHSKGEEIEITRRFAVGEGLAGWAAQEGKAILARDAKKFKRFSEGKTRPTADRSMIVVPVKVGDQVVGIISADQDRVNAFDERDLRMVETLALQAGTAIQNANLLAQERRRADAMDLLQQVSAKISATLDEKETLALTVEGAMRVLRMESGVIHLVDESKLAVTRSYEIPRGFGHPPPRLPKKEGLTWEIVSTGQMVDVPDIAEDKRVHPDMPTKEVKSIIGVPLEVEGRVIGALYMSDSKPREFTKYEKNLLSTLAGHAAIAIQNARLYEQRIRDIEAIQAINKAITAGEPSRTTTLDRILRLIVDRLVDVFQAASCAIRLYDPKLGGYGPRIASGALEKRVKFPPRLCGGSQHILETNKPIYAGDRSVVLPNGEPVIRQEIQKEGIRSVVYLPLLSERDVLGILYVEWTVPRQFFQNDRLILELFASQTAIAIENARLYNQRQNDIAAFQEINEAITTKEWSEIAMLIAQKAQELTHAEYSSLWLIDEKGKHLVMEAMYGYEAEVGRLLINKRSINGWVAMTGELYRCPDVREDPHYAKWYEDVRSNMTAPLTYGDRVIGTLTVESTRLDAFSDYQLGLLQSLADQAAVAIENAHLFKDARRRIRDLEIVNKVGQSISAQLNSQDLLQTIVSQIVDQLTCSHCTLFLLQKQNGEPVLVPQVTHGARREVMTRRFKPGEGLAGWVFQQG